MRGGTHPLTSLLSLSLEHRPATTPKGSLHSSYHPPKGKYFGDQLVGGSLAASLQSLKVSGRDKPQHPRRDTPPHSSLRLRLNAIGGAQPLKGIRGPRHCISVASEVATSRGETSETESLAASLNFLRAPPGGATELLYNPLEVGLLGESFDS